MSSNIGAGLRRVRFGKYIQEHRRVSRDSPGSRQAVNIRRQPALAPYNKGILFSYKVKPERTLACKLYILRSRRARIKPRTMGEEKIYSSSNLCFYFIFMKFFLGNKECLFDVRISICKGSIQIKN